MPILDARSEIFKGSGEVTIPIEFTVTEFILNTMPDGINKDDLDREAVKDVLTGEKLDYFELRQQIAKLASGLINNYRLKRGDVVAIFSPNHIRHVTILLAALSVGIIVTNINDTYTAEEVAYQLDHSQTKLIVSCPEIANVAKEAIDRLEVDISIVSIDTTENQSIKPFHHLLSSQPYDKLVFKEGECQETAALIVYSSGTTGPPKGIVNSHYNLITYVIQAHVYKNSIYSKFTLGNTPFFHISGISVILQGIYRHRTILTIRKFEPTLFLKTIEEFKLDRILLAPPVLQFLAKHPMIDNYNLTYIEKLICGGSTLPLKLVEEVVDRLGCKVEQAYGMTECTCIALADSDEMPLNSVGRLLPGISAKIVDPETKAMLSIEEKGELWIRSPSIMWGYHKNVKATRAMFDSDGFMCTGDVASFDHNRYLYIFDRSCEVIKYRGHRISPSYLESILLSHPAILDCCVVGVPHLPNEEQPRAYLVPNTFTNHTPTLLAEIETFAHSKLESHEYFHGGFKIVPKISRSLAGKVLRRVMRDKKLVIIYCILIKI